MIMLKYIEGEQYNTDTGVMLPVYRDWDEWHNGHIIKMVYTTTLTRQTSKCPMRHRLSTGLMTAVAGSPILEYYDGCKVISISLRHSTGYHIVKIPVDTWYSLRNDEDELAIVINMPNYAWRPDTNEKETIEAWSCLTG